MKKCYNLIMVFALILALCGLGLSLTIDTAEDFRDHLARGMIVGSVIALAVSAVLHPKIKGTEAFSARREKALEKDGQRCSFGDVAANEVALNSLKELCEYLKNPDRYAHYGARMPKGVLLYGPPGTGKTLLARALAGEAQVPFFALSGSDFVEKYVGVGASRVRNLFKKARKAGKCVIFIDEIDAMGKRRDDQSSDERDQTLNALLSEMSGFHTGDGVLIIAATNRMEMLDPALLRPGRFDRQIEVGLPGRAERLSILKLHARNKPLSDRIDLERIARQTTMFSGASLENLMNEAAILAARRSEGCIEWEDVDRAFLNIVAGPERQSSATNEDKCTIALHEAGHALMGRLLTPEAALVRVSILPAGHGAAGYNLCIPEEPVMTRRSALENQICVLLAGRGAEAMIGGEDNITAGARSDLDRATELAATMIMELGMGENPAVSLKALSRHCNIGDDGAEKSKKLLERLYSRTCEILVEHADVLMRLTKALIEEETLTGLAVDKIIGSVSNEGQKSA